ncbi:template-activating factor I [Nematocida homosporus]|uniref:template-activating factor I n=1 Tax=Nematocida homosporus TaxID=1912981 RepID=UPI00221EC61C|nr:template-activating factor I [Nematocida homosporus]KAI5187300.1 template-activating factor I [Nematocida homosporus]
MNSEHTLKELIAIQNSLDATNLKVLKKEFNSKQQDFALLKEELERRDKYAKELDGFWSTVFCNSDYFYVLLGKENCKEGEEECIPLDWIESLSVDYRPDFKFWVEIKVRPNEYFDNQSLTKEFSLFADSNQDQKWTAINWKPGKRALFDCPLIRFFTAEEIPDEDDNLNTFQILSDMYVNGVYYFMRRDEPEEIEE